MACHVLASRDPDSFLLWKVDFIDLVSPRSWSGANRLRSALLTSGAAKAEAELVFP